MNVKHFSEAFRVCRIHLVELHFLLEKDLNKILFEILVCGHHFKNFIYHVQSAVKLNSLRGFFRIPKVLFRVEKGRMFSGLADYI